MPRSASFGGLRRPHGGTLRLIVVAMLLVSAGACGSADRPTSSAAPTTAPPTTAPPTTTSPATTAPTTAPPTTAPTTTSATTTEPTTTTLPALRTITPDAPLRGFVGGDSLPAYIITGLDAGIADPALLDLRYDAQISSSIVRPSFVDWPQKLSVLLGTETEPSPDDSAPEAIVFMIGGNDNQPMTSSDGANLATLTPEWQDEYRRRVAAIMDLANRPGTRMLWIGLPPPRDGVRLELNPTLNAIFASEAEQRPWVTFLDINPLLSDADGNYARRLPGPDGGNPITVRPNDGVHITYGASRWIADLVWDWMTQTWSIAPTE